MCINFQYFLVAFETLKQIQTQLDTLGELESSLKSCEKLETSVMEIQKEEARKEEEEKSKPEGETNVTEEPPDQCLYPCIQTWGFGRLGWTIVFYCIPIPKIPLFSCHTSTTLHVDI